MHLAHCRLASVYKNLISFWLRAQIRDYLELSFGPWLLKKKKHRCLQLFNKERTSKTHSEIRLQKPDNQQKQRRSLQNQKQTKTLSNERGQNMYNKQMQQMENN